MSHRPTFAAMASISVFVFFMFSGSTQAQCSSGNRSVASGFQGLRGTGSGRELALASTRMGLTYAQRGTLAPPNVALQRQMQLIASNNRLQSLRRSQDQQSLLARRQARAAQTRQYRADRIARARAQREARTPSSGSDGDAMTLVSVRATPK